MLVLVKGLAIDGDRYPNTAQSTQTRAEQSDHSRTFNFPSRKDILIDAMSVLKRDEKDLVHIQSGLEQGVTLGTPIALVVKNEDQRPKDYSETDLYPRPSHADYTYLEKYGIKASSGGGRSSARETIGEIFLSL